MPNPFPYLLTERSLTFYVDGVAHQVLRDHPFFGNVVEAVEAGDPEAVELAKPVRKAMSALADLTPGTETERWFRRNPGMIEVTDYGVTVNGEAMHGHVVDRLMDVISLGMDAAPWVNFVRKLWQNPSSASREELYLWLEKAGMPICGDGDFLAYKRVRPDYRDIHSGTFDNSVGKVVEMSRMDVDDDRRKTCSTGLHFCSKSYLPHFSAQGNEDRVVVVKINPADVVSIPNDYDDAKGRCWRYVVVDEMSIEDAGLHRWEPVIFDWDEEDDYEYEDDLFDESDADDDENIWL